MINIILYYGQIDESPVSRTINSDYALNIRHIEIIEFNAHVMRQIIIIENDFQNVKLNSKKKKGFIQWLLDENVEKNI